MTYAVKVVIETKDADGQVMHSWPSVATGLFETESDAQQFANCLHRLGIDLNDMVGVED